MKTTSQNFLMASAIFILLSPCPAAALTMTTSAKYSNFIQQDITDNKSATSGSIASHLENCINKANGPIKGQGSAEAADSGILKVSSNIDVGGSDVGDTYSSSASWSKAYTNSSKTPEKYFLHINMSKVYLSSYWSGWAVYGASIYLNGSLLWSITDGIDGQEDSSQSYSKIIPALLIPSFPIGMINPSETFDLKYSIYSKVSAIEHGSGSVDPFTFSDSVYPAAVPEPTTIVFIGSGLIGVFMFKRKLTGRV